MGAGEKNFLSFHLHHHHQNHQQDHQSNEAEGMVVPKGCVGIRVGGEGEEQRRFVIPVVYVNHPLFMELLKEAEEEYGFDQKGPITIPCHVEEFRQVQGMIDKQNLRNHHHHHHHHHHHFLCFRV